MQNFKKWQNQNPSTTKRILILLLGALIFPTLIPALLVFVLPGVDRALGVSSLYSPPWNAIVGVSAILLGGPLALWSIITQIQLASGTPFPMLPTQKLLIVGPFRYCRNPMTLGTLVAYGGVAIWVGSIAAVAAVILLAALLITYLKTIEEKELELRFGEEYLAYKKSTPFIIPKLFTNPD